MDQSVRLKKSSKKIVPIIMNASQMYVHRTDASVKLHSNFYILENIKQIILLWKTEYFINENLLYIRYLDGSECKDKKNLNEGCANGVECISDVCSSDKCQCKATQ